MTTNNHGATTERNRNDDVNHSNNSNSNKKGTDNDVKLDLQSQPPPQPIIQYSEHILVTPTTTTTTTTTKTNRQKEPFMVEKDVNDETTTTSTTYLHVQLESTIVQQHQQPVDNFPSSYYEHIRFSSKKNQHHHETYEFQRMMRLYHVKKIQIHVSNLSYQTIPSLLTFRDNSVVATTTSGSSSGGGLPSGISISIEFWNQNDNDKNPNWYHNTKRKDDDHDKNHKNNNHNDFVIKKRFLQVVQYLMNQRYIIGPVGYGSMTNQRLHRYISIGNGNADSRSGNGENDSTTTTTKVVSTILPMDGSSMFSSEGFVALIKNYQKWIPPDTCSYNNDEEKIQLQQRSMWNVQDAYVWSNFMLGTTVGTTTTDDSEKKSETKIVQLSTLQHHHRSYSIIWTPNTYTMQVRYVLLLLNQQQQSSLSSSSSSYNISIQDLLPPGLRTMRNNFGNDDDDDVTTTTTTSANSKNIPSQQHKHKDPIDICSFYNGTYVHWIPNKDDLLQHTISRQQRQQLQPSIAKTITRAQFINKKNHSLGCENVNKETQENMVTTTRMINPLQTCFSLEVVVVQKDDNTQKVHDSSYLVTTMNENKIIQQIRSDHNEYDDDRYENNNNNNNMNNDNNNHHDFFFWHVSSKLVRRYGQDGDGTIRTRISNDHSSCPVTVRVTQPIPYVIQPIWRTLHGILIQSSSASSLSYNSSSTRMDRNNNQYIKWSDLKNRRVTFPYDGNRRHGVQQEQEQNKINQYILLEYEYTILPNHYFILSLDYRPLFLSFEEFPGDANRGFEIPPTKVVFQLFSNPSSLTTTTITTQPYQTINEQQQQQQQCQESMKRIQDLRHQLNSINNNPFLDSFDISDRSNSIYTKSTTVDINVTTTTNVASLLVLQMELYSNAQLILTPLPDMSMPYNVLSFTCTFYAFLFGSMFNLLIKKANTSMKKKLKDDNSSTTNTPTTLKGRILQKIRGTKDRIRQKIMAVVYQKRDPSYIGKLNKNVTTDHIGMKQVSNDHNKKDN